MSPILACTAQDDDENQEDLFFDPANSLIFNDTLKPDYKYFEAKPDFKDDENCYGKFEVITFIKCVNEKPAYSRY